MKAEPPIVILSIKLAYVLNTQSRCTRQCNHSFTVAIVAVFVKVKINEVKNNKPQLWTLLSGVEIFQKDPLS